MFNKIVSLENTNTQALFIENDPNKLQRGHSSFRPNVSLPRMEVEDVKNFLAPEFEAVIGCKIIIFNHSNNYVIKGIVSEEESAILDASSGNVLYKYWPIHKDGELIGYEILDFNGELLLEDSLVYDSELRVLFILD